MFFPVLDSNRNIEGEVWLSDIRGIMFDVSLYDTIFVRNIMHSPQDIIHLNIDNTEDIMQKI